MQTVTSRRCGDATISTMRKVLVFVLFLTGCASSSSVRFETIGSAELVSPGLVSTPRTEVRLAISPDGTRMLWGVLEWAGGPGGWEIVESVRAEDGTWSSPRVAAFSSKANDFDPAFAPDGRGVYFFSNREGGLGGDDIYFLPFDGGRGEYGAVRSLGPNVNSAGDEWAPVVSRDQAELLFASDGRGGAGKHDLFFAKRDGDGWGVAENATSLNTAAEDFDATILHDGRSIVLSSGSFDGAIHLYFVPYRAGAYGAREKLGPAVNSTEPEAWTFGPSIGGNEPGVLYFTSHHAINVGRADIYKIRYRMLRKR
jgi:TolB protein